MSLENRDIEQKIKNPPAPSSIDANGDNIALTNAIGKQTQILDDGGNPIATFDNDTKKTTLKDTDVQGDLSIDGDEV